MISVTRRLGQIKDHIYRMLDKQTLQRALGRGASKGSPEATLQHAAPGADVQAAKPSATDLFATLDQQLAHSPRYRVVDVFEEPGSKQVDTMWSQTTPAHPRAPVKSGR